MIPSQPSSPCAVLVRVKKTRGSTPREAGARMWVEQARVLGTIGGGHLEFEAIRIARNMLEAVGDAVGAAATRRFSLGAGLGQCCGGVVELSFEPQADAAGIESIEDANRLPIVLFGAGHVGRALARLLVDLPCTLNWVDSRAEEFGLWSLPSPAPSHITQTLTDEPLAAVAAAPAGSAFVVMTHSHALDFELCEAILRRADFVFAGVIGSATKAARFRHRLSARGMPSAAIERLACPLGMQGLTGKEPAVIALAAAAELMRHRQTTTQEERTWKPQQRSCS